MPIVIKLALPGAGRITLEVWPIETIGGDLEGEGLVLTEDGRAIVRVASFEACEESPRSSEIRGVVSTLAG